MKSMKSMKNM